MIVKYTFKDNDFTQIIEEYLDDFGPFYAFNYISFKDLNEFKKLVRQYDDYNDKYNKEKELTKAEYKTIKFKLISMLYKNFKTYINNIQPNSKWHTDGFDAAQLNEDKDYIFKNIKISIVKSITDQWENGEVVYYFTSNQKYMRM